MAQTITQATLKLSRDTVESWPGAIIASGMKVLAPILLNTGQSEYALLTSAAPKATGLGKGLPRLSPKPAWFPRSEPILTMERIGREWRMDDPDMQFPPVVIFGARPCDAAAPEILAPLFGWDFHDPFFEKRRKQIAFVVLACQKSVDAACFCTSVNGDPAGENVGDVTLTEAADGGFIAQITDTKTGSVVAVSSAAWKCKVIHKAPTNPACEKDPDPEATCLSEIADEPSGWRNAGYDVSAWASATEYTAAAVGPKEGYNDITWNLAAKLIWTSDLKLDNTLLCKVTIESP